MTHPTDIDVLIVGAGPTGLTMACLLAQYGIQFRIVEKNQTITTQSKALAVQARTLELFEQLGIAAQAVSEGRPAPALNLFTKGRHWFRLDLKEIGKGLTKYPFLLILEQSKTEQLLLNRLTSLGQKVRWQTELVDLQQSHDAVKVGLCHQGKIEFLRARYVIAADGAHSIVRTALQIPFGGGTYEHRYLLADLTIRGPLPSHELSVCFSSKGFAAFFPFLEDFRYRAISENSRQSSRGREPSFQEVTADLKAESALPLQTSDPRWITTYRLHHRAVRSFKVQSCFFLGDAAHIHSPIGGQGMNTGIQDSFNLAWKLSWVLKGFADEKILQSYHRERYPVARNLIRTTDKLFNFVINPNPVLRWVRLNLLPRILSLVIQNPRLRRWLFTSVSQIRIHYRGCDLNQHQAKGKTLCKAGDRFPSFLLSAEALSTFANDGNFHVFVMGPLEEQHSLQRVLNEYLGPLVMMHTLEKRGDIHALLSEFGLPKDGLILVRPDQYVGYVADGLDVNALKLYLQNYFHPQVTLQGQKRLLRTDALPESFI